MTTKEPLDRFETELLAELREVVARTGPDSAPRRPSWRRPAISMGAVAAAAATVLLITSGVGPGGTSTASAADVLLDAARHAESLPPDAGRYWYVHTISSLDEGSVHDGTEEYETWQRRDGSVWDAVDAGQLQETHGAIFDLCSLEVDLAELRALPTEPDALRAALEDATMRAAVRDAKLPGNAGLGSAEFYDSLVTGCTISLLTMPVSNATRGAAYRSLAALPDVENLGSTTDGQGRTGTELAFRYDFPNDEHSLHIVVDPDSGDLLQHDFVGEKGEFQMTVLEAGWTDTIRR